MNPSAGRDDEMRRYWNARAQEDPFHFVDNRQRYRAPDERFWDAGPLLDYALEMLGVELHHARTVLEIGCGIGRITRILAARADEVLALDVSDAMLRLAAEHNPELGNVQWLLGDGASLEGVGSESVDVCISIVVFQHLPDPAIALGYIREVGRVLAPNGWAALQVSNDPGVHRPQATAWSRAKAAVGLAPKGQRHPAWVGSAVDLTAARKAAGDAGCQLERVWGEGTQYCLLLLRKLTPEGGGDR